MYIARNALIAFFTMRFNLRRLFCSQVTTVSEFVVSSLSSITSVSSIV